MYTYSPFLPDEQKKSFILDKHAKLFFSSSYILDYLDNLQLCLFENLVSRTKQEEKKNEKKKMCLPKCSMFFSEKKIIINLTYFSSIFFVQVSSVAPVTYALNADAHYQARPTYSASSNPPMSRPQQPVMRVSYTYGQPTTTSYSYGAVASGTSANMYAMNPTSSSVAQNNR